MVKDVNKESTVLSSCLRELSSWQARGLVIYYTRVNSGKVETKWGTWIQLAEKGTPDIFAFLNVNGTVYVYFIECKRPNGGVWGYEQQEFKFKFKGVKNVIYELVDDCRQVDKTLMELSEEF